MNRIDIEEIGFAVRMGGKIGLVILAPPSALLTIMPITGDFSFASLDDVSRWVRFGFEVFLMGGWAAGAVSLVRQLVARSVGALLGFLTGGATGVLVMHLMAVIFILISGDAPDLLEILLGGSIISFSISGALTHRAQED